MGSDEWKLAAEVSAVSCAAAAVCVCVCVCFAFSVVVTCRIQFIVLYGLVGLGFVLLFVCQDDCCCCYDEYVVVISNVEVSTTSV